MVDPAGDPDDRDRPRQARIRRLGAHVPSRRRPVSEPIAGGDQAEDQGPEADSRADKTEKGKARSVMREIATVVVAALVLSFLVRTFLVQAFYVPSQSMENTLMPNDRILASKITTKISGVNRGEIVVFKDPGGWLTAPVKGPNPIQAALEFVGLMPSSSGDDLVKRVIGVAGDHVVCCSPQGQIVLNGVALDEPYIKPGSGTDQRRFDVIVPPDSVFVMGDNRADSADSRFHPGYNDGGVPVQNVVGRVVVRIWPLGQMSTFGVPTVFENPALDQQGAEPTPPGS